MDEILIIAFLASYFALRETLLAKYFIPLNSNKNWEAIATNQKLERGLLSAAESMYALPDIICHILLDMDTVEKYAPLTFMSRPFPTIAENKPTTDATKTTGKINDTICFLSSLICFCGFSERTLKL